MQKVTEHQAEKLIACVRKHPVLYSKSEKGYKMLNHKQKIWSEISKKTGINDPLVCQKAWRSLRDQFVKSYKDHLHSNGKESEKKKYKHFESLLFLVDHNEPEMSANRTPRQYGEEYAPVEETCDSMPSMHFEEIKTSPVDFGFTFQSCHSRARTPPDVLDVASSSKPAKKRKVSEALGEDERFKAFIEGLAEKYLTEPDDTDKFFAYLSSVLKKYQLTAPEMLTLQCNLMNELKAQLHALGKL